MTNREEYLKICGFSDNQLRITLPITLLLVEYLQQQTSEIRRNDLVQQIRLIGASAYFFGGCDAMRFLITGLEEAFLLDDNLKENHSELRLEIASCLNHLWDGIGEWQP